MLNITEIKGVYIHRIIFHRDFKAALINAFIATAKMTMCNVTYRDNSPDSVNSYRAF